MKRSKMLKEIKKVLNTWQGSRLGLDTANEILTKLESLGMKPPALSNLNCIDCDNGTTIFKWDKEK